MRRRDFIKIIAASASALPLAARAQQPERVRRVGVLMALAATDAEGQARLAAFLQGLQEYGWAVGRNMQVDIRWAAGNADDIRKYAAELIALAPDVILVSGGTGVGPMLQMTRTVPIVFTQTFAPVSSGFVASLARPGGNATGFTGFESNMGAKWLELLKEIAPGLTRAAVLRDPASPQGLGQLGAIQTAAHSAGIDVRPVNVRNGDEIDRDITGFVRGSNSGLIVLGSGFAIDHRKEIVALAARYKLPAIYPFRIFVTDGGLMAYGHDSIDPHRRAAAYADRILKGEKPADMPVQAPTKYDLVINLKTAKALGLTVPRTLLAQASEVIE
jgi:putative ABC transport system substrate-binding protein